MASEPQDGGPCMNTDRHLWPETSDPHAERESIHVTAQGGIGINVGGYVYVKPLREWHKLAGGKEAMQPAREVMSSKDVSDTERDVRSYVADAKKYGFLGGIPVREVEVLLQVIGGLRGGPEPESCSACVEAHGLIPSWLEIPDGDIADCVGDLVERFEALWKERDELRETLAHLTRGQSSGETTREPPYFVQTFWSPDKRYLVTAHATPAGIVTLQDDNGREWEAASPQQDMTLPEEERKTRSPIGQLFAELAKEEDDSLFCGDCGHSFGQHSKGPSQALYCRHCPCPQWQPEQVKTNGDVP